MGLWSTLLPLIVASALVPVQIALTILLLRSSQGTAAAWVGGMTATRLVQGVVFGLIFGGAGAASGAQGGPGLLVSGILLVIALLLLTKAAKELLGGREADEDAPPPKWMKLTESVTPGKAFLLGAGYIAVAAKLWVFTLGAIGAIAEAAPGKAASIALFVVFVALVEAIPIGVVVYAAAAPGTSHALLDRMSAWLERNNRTILIVLGLVFGAWFLLKALQGLGLL
jgi:hypothetical protein